MVTGFLVWVCFFFLSSEALCIFLTNMGKQMVEYERKSNRCCKISRLPKLFSSFLQMYSGIEREPVLHLLPLPRFSNRLLCLNQDRNHESSWSRLQVQNAGFHYSLPMYGDYVDEEAQKLFRKFFFFPGCHSSKVSSTLTLTQLFPCTALCCVALAASSGSCAAPNQSRY